MSPSSLCDTAIMVCCSPSLIKRCHAGSSLTQIPHILSQLGLIEASRNAPRKCYFKELGDKLQAKDLLIESRSRKNDVG